MIDLKFVTIERDGEYAVTTFKSDGAVSRARNTRDPYQLQICGWVGCGEDIDRYNFEHEFIHSFLAEKFWDAESYVLSRDARFDGRMSKVGGLFEERWCYHFHCYLNGTGDALEPEWVEWRKQARELLDHA